MENQLLCYDCLTDEDRSVVAVTMFNGTTYCEKCARERSAAMAQMSETISQGLRTPPIRGL